MFQAIKRAKFISQNNFSHYDTGDLAHMHLWLQKAGWPANEFVDLFMRAHPNFDPLYLSATFKQFMCQQYDTIQNGDGDALRGLRETLSSDRFRAVDKDGLLRFVDRMLATNKN